MPVQDEVPKSRITLTYKTEVDGEPAVVDLPLRLMALGDFSNGSSKDRQAPLEERALRNMNGRNTDEVMRDMNINLDMVVPNKINPSEEEMRVQLKIDGMSAFNPDEVAKQIPQVRSLLLLKKLLEEVQSNVANKKEFAQLLSRLYADPEALNEMRKKLQNYAMYRLPDEIEVANESKS